MNTIDRDTLFRLADRAAWPSASLYLPVDHTGIHTDADRIRLRNLAKKAYERLGADGLRETEAEAMVGGAMALGSDDSAWTGGPSGLALFVTPEGTETLWLDVTMPELVVVGDRFYLRPIYPAYAGERKAWALALDSNKTRLFHFDPTSIEEVALPKGTQVSLTADLDGNQHEESLQFHTIPGATPEGAQGVNSAMFNGHGGEKDFDKVERGQFLLQLANGVLEVIGAESAEPLVLLGVSNMIDEFRAASHYTHIAGEAVHGATDQLSPADVQRRALAVLMPAMQAEADAALEEYRKLAGTGKTSSDAAEIVAAAASGRVKTLIMDDSSGPWGWFDRATFEVTHLCQIEPRMLRDTMDAASDPDMFECGWDLIDLAAAETARHRGTVLAYRGEASPITGAVAVFRY
ncbi:MAG TPA: hypothetical protein VIK85_06710 [Coriobacteriia bacterium]